MSAFIIVFPATQPLSRATIEATIDHLINLLDTEDLPTADCELDVDEASDEGEIEAWPEWHTRISPSYPGR